MKNIVKPLTINGMPAGRRTEEEMLVQSKGGDVYPQYIQTSRQADVWTGYQGKLQYDIAKMQIDLEKKQITMEQRLEYEKQINELRIQYACYLQMMSITVYLDTNGNIICAFSAPDEKTITSRVLLNVKNYHSRIYVSYYPELRMVLELKWGNGSTNSIRFLYTDEGILPNNFLRRLKARGVLLLVSGRAEKKAACALLAYSIDSAEKIEIPFSVGWGKNKAGKWHYAAPNELTIREVIKDAII